MRGSAEEEHALDKVVQTDMSETGTSEGYLSSARARARARGAVRHDELVLPCPKSDWCQGHGHTLCESINP